MIKITFEFSEDFIRENSDIDKALETAKDKSKALRSVANAIAFGQLNDLIQEGKTEFVVTEDKLDKMSKVIYDTTIRNVCVLAAYSETDEI